MKQEISPHAACAGMSDYKPKQAIHHVMAESEYRAVIATQTQHGCNPPFEICQNIYNFIWFV